MAHGRAVGEAAERGEPVGSGVELDHLLKLTIFIMKAYRLFNAVEEQVLSRVAQNLQNTTAFHVFMEATSTSHNPYDEVQRGMQVGEGAGMVVG